MRDVLRVARIFPWNSSSLPLGASVGLGSPNYCPGTPAPHQAPAGPGSFLWLPACSTCSVRCPARWRDRTRDGDRHCVASTLGSSYCLCSRRVARRALCDSDTSLADSVCHEQHALPSRTAYRDLALFLLGVIGIPERKRHRIEDTDAAASSKVTRCFLAFAAALITEAPGSQPNQDNDSGIELRAREGAQRPTRPSAANAGLARDPPPISLGQMIDEGLRYCWDRRTVIEPEPPSINTRARRSQTVPLVWMKVVGRHLGSGDVLSPRRRDPRRAAAGYLHDEAAAVTIKLHGEKVDSLLTDTTEVRKRSLEPSCTERWNQGLFQRGCHGISVHISSG